MGGYYRFVSGKPTFIQGELNLPYVIELDKNKVRAVLNLAMDQALDRSIHKFGEWAYDYVDGFNFYKLRLHFKEEKDAIMAKMILL